MALAFLLTFPSPGLLPLESPCTKESLGIKDGWDDDTVAVRHPFPTRKVLLLFYQIRGNRNFTITSVTRTASISMTMYARIGDIRRRASTGWKDAAVIYRATLSAFGSIDESISRGDVRSFPITHVEFLSFFLSFFLSPPFRFFFYFLHPCCGFDTFLIRCSITATVINFHCLYNNLHCLLGG